MDNKLFELCKEVSETLGWAVDEVSNLHRKWGYNGIGNLQQEPIQGGIFRGQVPVYTSDYLLEKLPKEKMVAVIKDVVHHLEKSKKWVTNEYYAHTMNGQRHHKSDTPLKALLKLVLALKEAGEL